MRVRIKFSKEGSLKYIGHLDVMRFFQKAIRRAGLDVVYSEGFSPHMLMSFAQPLGVGLTSEAEYFDLDLKTAQSSSCMTEALNAQMPQEIRVLNIVQIPEDKKNKGMTLVAGALYTIGIKDGNISSYKDEFEEFMRQDKIEIVKKTKKNETLTDIRPLIYDYKFEDDKAYLKLSAGSVNNLKPQLVMDAFFSAAGISGVCEICRCELYADVDGELVPLYKLGEEIV